MGEIDQLLTAADACAKRGVPVALATVVDVRGSSYRRPGARLLVPADGPPVGLISGGCLEEEAARLARDAIHSGLPRLVTIDHSAEGDELWGSGLGCRGIVMLFAEPPALAAETLAALRAAGSDGTATYQLTALAGARRRLSASQAAALSDRADAERPSIVGERVLDPILPPVELVVCGAGPDAVALVEGATRLGWRATVADPRRSLLRADRFPGARLTDLPPPEAARQVAPGRRTAVVIMGHDYLRDAEYLAAFAGTEAAYLGMIGPRDRTERITAEVDVPPWALERLHAPAGLDIGADGAEEVATSILAEILAVLRGRFGGALRDQPGPIHG